MKKILDEIQSGKFAEEWVAESEAGRANFNALREAGPAAPDREGRRRAAGDDAVDLGRQAEGRPTPPAAEPVFLVILSVYE